MVTYGSPADSWCPVGPGMTFPLSPTWADNAFPEWHCCIYQGGINTLDSSANAEPAVSPRGV